MTALKPTEHRRVLSEASTTYPINTTCSHPECALPAASVHHCYPRGQIKGDSYFVAIYFDDEADAKAFANTFASPPKVKLDLERQLHKVVISHATGVCGSGTTGHHGAVEEHKSWIRLEDGEWRWYDRGGKGEEEWKLVGALDPQPGQGVKSSKRPRKKDEARRNAPTMTLRMNEEGQRGRIEDKIEQLRELAYGDEPRTKTHILELALDHTLLNTDATDFTEG